MAYTKTNWTNTTPINIENLNNIENGIADLFDAIFPVGQIVIKGDDADYSNWLDFTWERTAVGRVLVGYDYSDTDFNTIGKIGGSKKLQSHQHTLNVGWKNLDAGGSFPGYTSQASGSGVTSLTTENYGEGNSGNLQPYQVVAYWKRIL